MDVLPLPTAQFDRRTFDQAEVDRVNAMSLRVLADEHYESDPRAAGCLRLLAAITDTAQRAA